MKRVPHAQGVLMALRSVHLATKKSLKGVNVAAGQRMAKGDYATGEALAAKGREIGRFQTEVEALHKHWREVCGRTSGKMRRAVTPLWAYYQPILQAIVQAGGAARRSDLEGPVERIMGPSLQAGDRSPMSGGRERWRVMIQRARKPIAAESWIEGGGGPEWRITDSGRRTSEKALVRDPGARK
jgi:hypothetical protein